MHVLDLPCDCIIHILKPILPQLTSFIQKSLVHPKFHIAVAETLRAYQSSCKLFDTRENVDFIRENFYSIHNLMTFPELAIKNTDTEQDFVVVNELIGEPVTELLTSFYFNVKQLMLFTLSVDHIYLLQRYRELTTLTLMELPDCQKFQNQLWDTMDQHLPGLRHLHLFCINLLIAFPNHVPVLNRLESFTLLNYEFSNFLHLTGQLSDNLRLLRIRQDYGPIKQLFAQLITGDRICETITHLDVQPYREKYSRPLYEELLLIKSNFKALTFLNMQNLFSSMYQITIEHLSALPHLTELRLTGHDYIGNEVSGLNRLVNLQLPSLRTIYLSKALNYCHYPSDQERIFLQMMFKPLNEVEFEGFSTRLNTLLFPALQELYFELHRTELYDVITGLKENEKVLRDWGLMVRRVRVQVPPDARHKLKLYWTFNGQVHEDMFV